VVGRPRLLSAERARTVIVAVAIVLVASGCWFGRGRETQLREAARSLLPPGASVVVEEAADCVELAPSPSCVHIWFVTAKAPLSARVRAVRERADAEGWELEREEFLQGGASVRFRRRGMMATAHLWREWRAGPCREAPQKDCADAVFVERT
jgi:hypothetical protein